jgi:hypothetical protein
MGRRVATPMVDPRPLILRLAIMAAGILVLILGTVIALSLVVMAVAGGSEQFAPGGSWDVSRGGAILGMAAAAGIGAFLGWRIFLAGRFARRPLPARIPPRDAGNDWD